MKNNETGEFELVVGDRQLLSAFFIVVLLCAVAFAMGYVVGQNAPKSGKQAAETPPVAPATSAGEARPQPLPPAPSAAAPPSPAATDVPAQPADSAPQPTTQPAQTSQPQPPDTQPPPATTAPAAPGLVAADDLPSGNYWQVMSVQQPQAEVIRTTLKDHGFGVILSPGPKGLTRVLVGPYSDTQTFGKAKSELENAGMHPVRYKP
jgi:cell division septation protein DedD